MHIKLENLSKSYREGSSQLRVIESLSFEFESGSRNAIVGKSGIGKSTLLHLLGGLDRPSGGTIFFDETNIFALEDEKLSALRGEKVGFVFQFHHLLPEFNALENIAMPLLIARQSEEHAFEKALQLLSEVGLTNRASHRPGELSGGEQQRVALARALVIEPALLLADEPTGNLDYKTAAEVQELLLQIAARYNTTLIIATHNIELARSMDRCYEMLPGGSLTAQ